MVKATTRQRLGANFSEGARRMWIESRSRGLGQRQLGELLSINNMRAHRLLWGDSLPTLEESARIARALGIEAALFLRNPTRKFRPSAAA